MEYDEGGRVYRGFLQNMECSDQTYLSIKTSKINNKCKVAHKQEIKDNRVRDNNTIKVQTVRCKLVGGLHY